MPWDDLCYYAIQVKSLIELFAISIQRYIAKLHSEKNINTASHGKIKKLVAVLQCNNINDDNNNCNKNKERNKEKVRKKLSSPFHGCIQINTIKPVFPSIVSHATCICKAHLKALFIHILPEYVLPCLPTLFRHHFIKVCALLLGELSNFRGLSNS